MRVSILAREGSSRYPKKHLHPIDGSPMISGMIKRLIGHGAEVVLTTSRFKDNFDLIHFAYHAGAAVYCEEKAPEWDLVSRQLNMAKWAEWDHWLTMSGDCPFSSLEIMDDVWAELDTGKWDKVNIGKNLHSSIGERVTVGETRRYWEAMNAYFDPEDRRREQPGFFRHDEYFNVKYIEDSPLANVVTPVKLSVDWPLEGALMDLIVRHLGHWPESDEEIFRCYREIKSLKEDT